MAPKESLRIGVTHSDGRGVDVLFRLLSETDDLDAITEMISEKRIDGRSPPSRVELWLQVGYSMSRP